MSEHDEQCLIFDWAKLSTKKYPALKFMYSTLNGIRLTIGSAVKAKKSGNKSGVPDIVLPYPSSGFNGLYVELKVKGGRAKPDQLEFIDFLSKNNFKAEVVYGSKNAIKLIKDYLDGKLH